MTNNPYEQRFGFLMTDIARLLGTHFDRRARQQGFALSRAQCRVALYLSTLGPMSQTRLAEILEVAPISVARMIDRMQEAGLVERAPSPVDRRAFLVRATRKADRVMGDAMRLGDEVAELALQGLDAKQRRALLTLLAAIRANLGSG